MEPPFDLILRNGIVLDPAENFCGKRDIFVRHGLICSQPDAPRQARALFDFDVEGRYVFPGLIDFHAHVYTGGSDLGVNPHTTLVPTGVTTVVDAGTAGTGQIDGLISEISAAQMRIRAFVNVTPSGLATFRTHQKIDASTFDRDRLERIFRRYAHYVLGIKFMAGKEINDDLSALDATLEIAESLRVPVAVHTTNPPASMAEIAGRLRKGDILVHVMHGEGQTILDGDGSVNKALRAARERGVIMDASNGRRHFNFDVARAALAQGFPPDVISSDMTAYAVYIEPVVSLPHILSKYLNLGMPLMDVLRCATATPARLCRMEGEIGTLRVGARADIAVMELAEKAVVFKETQARDSRTMTGKQYLLPQMTIIDGIVAYRSPNIKEYFY